LQHKVTKYRAYSTDVATRFDTITAAVKQMGSGLLRP